MSPKPCITIDNHCQHISPKGQRCHMLIDDNHRTANGAKRSTLCAYHANRLNASAPPVEPEVLAADLLGDIDDFSSAASVNLFLGNLVKQLAPNASPAAMPSPWPTSPSCSSTVSPLWSGSKPPTTKPKKEKTAPSSCAASMRNPAN